VRSAALAALNGDAGGASIKRRVTSGLMSASRHEKMRAQRMRAMDATRRDAYVTSNYSRVASGSAERRVVSKLLADLSKFVAPAALY